MWSRDKRYEMRRAVHSCVEENMDAIIAAKQNAMAGELAQQAANGEDILSAIDGVRADLIANTGQMPPVDGQLFGSISDVIAREVQNEVLEVSSATYQPKHIIPDDIISYAAQQKNDVSEAVLQSVHFDSDFLAYLEIYNRMAKTDEQSAEADDHVIKNQDIALDLFDSVATQYEGSKALLYGAALSDVERDGYKPDIDVCKQEFVKSINEDLKAASKEENPKEFIDEVKSGLSDISRELTSEGKTSEIKIMIDASVDLFNEKDFMEVADI